MKFNSFAEEEYYIKTNIDLTGFAVKHGFRRKKRSTDKWTRLEKNGQLILIYQDDKGIMRWGDFVTNNKTIIDFVQLIINPNYNIRQAKDYILSFAGEADVLMKSSSVPIPKNNSLLILSENIIKNLYDFKQNVYAVDYLKERSIYNAAKEPYFQDKILSIKGKYVLSPDKKLLSYDFIAYPLYNKKGIASITLKHHSFKNIRFNIGKKKSSIWLSNYDKNQVDTLFIFECVEDTLSYYHINKQCLLSKHCLFISTQGSITTEQVELINQIVKKHKIKEIHTGFDNDKQGAIYNVILLSKTVFNNQYGFDFKKTSHAGDGLYTLDIFSKDSLIDTDMVKKYLDFKRMNKDDVQVVLNAHKISITVRGTLFFIKCLGDLINHIKFNNTIQIEYAQNEDFNQDLMLSNKM